MRTYKLPMLPIHESKTSSKVIRFALERDLSKSYFKKIRKAHEDGDLYGLYFTNKGKIRAVFSKIN